MKHSPCAAAILVALLSMLVWIGEASAVIIDFVEPPNEGADGRVVTVRVDLEGRQFTVLPSPATATAERASLELFIPFVEDFDPLTDTVVGVMLEPGSSRQAPVISDLILVSLRRPSGAATGVIATLTFQSDSETGPPLTANLSSPNILGVVVEDGTLQTIIDIVADIPLSAGGEEIPVRFVVRAQSDAVPEPGTLLLVGSGLLGIGAAWRARAASAR